MIFTGNLRHLSQGQRKIVDKQVQEYLEKGEDLVSVDIQLSVQTPEEVMKKGLWAEGIFTTPRNKEFALDFIRTYYGKPEVSYSDIISYFKSVGEDTDDLARDWVDGVKLQDQPNDIIGYVYWIRRTFMPQQEDKE